MERFFDHLLLGIESRGGDSTGFITMSDDGTTVLDKNPVTASDFIKTRKKFPKGTRGVLGHTRFATQGHQSRNENNHPVQYKTVFTTHNGVIHNDDVIFEKYEELERTAEVDTIAIPAMLSHFGFLNPEEAFKPLGGGFATASVDPVNHPGVILLAKGRSYPLVLHENKNFVVWASTAMSIQEAWKAILGTPPALNKFEHFQDGDVVWLRDGEVTKELKKFTQVPVYRSYVYNGNHGSYSHRSPVGTSVSTRAGWLNTDDDWDDIPGADDGEGAWEAWWQKRNSRRSYQSSGGGTNHSTARSGRVEVKSYEAAVKTLVEHGTSKVYLWDNRDNMAEEDKKKHDGRWTYCRHCKRTCARFQTYDSTKWGEICADCASLAMAELKAAEINSETKEKNRADENMVTQLEAWVKLEAFIHHEAITLVAKSAACSADLCEYLLYRASDKHIDGSQNLKEFADLLNQEFDLIEETLWEMYRTGFDARSQITDGADDKDYYVICGDYIHWASEACTNCTEVTVMGPVCAVPPPSEEVVPALRAPVEKRKCLSCRKAAKVYLGLKAQWCDDHYDKCSKRGCKFSPVGWQPDGKRLCHTHFRGVKGGLMDNDWRGRNRVSDTDPVVA